MLTLPPKRDTELNDFFLVNKLFIFPLNLKIRRKLRILYIFYILGLSEYKNSGILLSITKNCL